MNHERYLRSSDSLENHEFEPRLRPRRVTPTREPINNYHDVVDAQYRDGVVYPNTEVSSVQRVPPNLSTSPISHTRSASPTVEASPRGNEQSESLIRAAQQYHQNQAQYQLSAGTPSMRRHQIADVQRTHAHQKLIEQQEFTLFYETMVLLYLTFCVASISQSMDFECQVNVKYHTRMYLLWVIWPTVAFRYMGYLWFKDTDFNSFNNFCFLLNLYWNASYGIWTFLQASMLLGIDRKQDCEMHRAGLLEVNYEIVMIFGIFPVLLTTFFSLALCIGLPFLAYNVYRHHQETLGNMQRTKNLISGLVRTKWDEKFFQTQEQCAICLIDFDEEAEVTPLPCDIRHYYHTACILSWIDYENCCPLCKTPITLEDIERVANDYQKLLQEHQSCCASSSAHASSAASASPSLATLFSPGVESSALKTHQGSIVSLNSATPYVSQKYGSEPPHLQV